MRITAEAKSATRTRILEAAVSLFRRKGFSATTTRDIAQAANIATGTLFNYFATKEAIVGSLAAQALDKAHRRLEHQASGADLEEDLFALVATELRELRSLRKYIVPVLESTLSPLAATHRADDRLRVEHLETVSRLALMHGHGALSSVAVQLYWTLYTGVLAFWADDKSPKQEDTLAMLDQSLAMYAAWLCAGSPGT